MEKELRDSILSLESLRKIDPSVANLDDEELEKTRRAYYEMVQLIYEDWQIHLGSKFPEWLLTDDEEVHTLELCSKN